MTNKKIYGPKVLGVVCSRNGLPKYQYHLDLSGLVGLVPKMKAIVPIPQELTQRLLFEHICFDVYDLS